MKKLDDQKIVKDREIEIKYISDLIKQKQNIHTVGKKGVGKTEIVKAVSKKLNKKIHVFDMATISKNDFKKSDVFKWLCLKGKTKYVFSHKLIFLYKLWIPFFSFYYVSALTLLSQGIINGSVKVQLLFWGVPIITAALFYSILFFVWWFTHKGRIIMISEINFIRHETSFNSFVHNIYKCYSNNDVFVIESSGKEFDKSSIIKLNCTSIKIVSTRTNIELFNSKIINNKNLFVESGSITAMLWSENLKKYINNYQGCQIDINIILMSLTYRDIQRMIIEMRNEFKFLKGEFNFVDYITVFYLKLNEKEFLEYMVQNMSELQANAISKNNSPSNEIVLSYKNKLSELKNGKTSKTIIENAFWVFDHGIIFTSKDPLTNNRKFSFTDINYMENYLNISTYSYLNADYLKEFKKSALDFLKKIGDNFENMSKIPFDIITDLEANQFIQQMLKLSNDDIVQLPSLQNYVYFASYTIRYIMESRRDKYGFVKNADDKIRFSLAFSYFHDLAYRDSSEVDLALKDLKIRKITKEEIPMIPIYNEIKLKYHREYSFFLFDQQVYFEKLIENNSWDIIKRILFRTSSFTTKGVRYYGQYFELSNRYIAKKNMDEVITYLEKNTKLDIWKYEEGLNKYFWVKIRKVGKFDPNHVFM